MKRTIIVLLIIGAILRLVSLPSLLVFTPDESYFMYFAQTLAKDFHILWIGVSALGLDFYMGPFWIYVLYPFVWLFRGDPLFWGVISSLLGVATIYLTYWFGKKVFNERVGIFAALIYTFSPLIIYYDQKPYPSGVPFLSMVLAISLYMTKFSNRWWIIFAIAFGWVFHIHLSLTLIIFVAIYWALSHRKMITKKIVILSAVAFLLTISPMLVFDYFHNASNITAPLRILQMAKSSKSSLDLNVRINGFVQPMGRIWYLGANKNSADEILNPCIIHPVTTTTRAVKVLSAVSLVLIALFLLNKKTWEDDGKRLIVFLSCAFIVPFLFLNAINPVEYYFLGFFPLLFIVLASIIDALKGFPKMLAVVGLFAFAMLGIFTIATAKDDFGLGAKRRIINKVMEKIGDAPYALSEEGGCHKYEGWRYLFSVYGRRPVQSSDDVTFGWLYPGELSKVKPVYQVIMKETRAPQTVDQNYLHKFEEGGFSAYVYQ